MSFCITIEPSGRTFYAEPHETVLAAAIRAGVGLPYGCRDGACGTCKCKMPHGQVRHGVHQEKALSLAEQAQDFILPCAAYALSDLTLQSHQVTDESAFSIKKMPARIQSVQRLSGDVMHLRLQLPMGERLKYHAGQYVEFLLADGQRRSYSIANAPHTQEQTPGLEFHVRHLPGGRFTDHVFASMKEKEIVRIEGPYGSFFLREDSRQPIVLLASGTGFAPIKALIEHMQYKGIERPAVLYWGGRRPADLYLHDWMNAQVQHMPHLRYVPVISDAHTEDAWQGRTGLVHEAVLQDQSDLSNYQVYACGAPVMVEHARTDYIKRAGLAQDAFFADPFVTQADKSEGCQPVPQA